MLETHCLASPNPINQIHFIDYQCVNYDVQQPCQVLDVVPSRYDAWWYPQAAGAVETSEPALEMKIIAVLDHHKRRRGTQRLLVKLWGKGHWVGR